MADIEVTNRTRARIDQAKIGAFAAAVLSASGKYAGAAVSVTFVGDRRMQELNSKWRGIDRPTDVLSFNMDEAPETPGGRFFLGDVVISSRQAALDAAEEGISFGEKTRRLVLHGLLHLMGYDHETPADARAMRRRELALMKKTRGT